MDKWFANGATVDAPALVYRTKPACALTHVFLAANLRSVNGEPVELQFLDHRFNTKNSSVAVDQGVAEVKPETDGSGFTVTPGPSQAGHSITLAITIAGKGKYLFSFQVTGKSAARLKSPARR